LSTLGAPTRPLRELADWIVESPHDQTLMAQLPPPLRADWRAATKALATSCHRLEQLGPDPTLVNSDFHPWNVALAETGAVLFDWNDPAITHPFLDLATYLLRTANRAFRRDLLNHYLASWGEQLPQPDLQEAGRLALIVGCLYQVRMYSQLLPTLMPDDLGQLAKGDQHWMGRALRTLEHGIDMTY
jgi:Phosphotransferase enzyme family